MIEGNERVYNKFTQQVIAVNYAEALFLKRFVLECFFSKYHLNSTEIIDIQQYRLVKKKNKINDLLKLPENQRLFLFPVNIN